MVKELAKRFADELKRRKLKHYIEMVQGTHGPVARVKIAANVDSGTSNELHRVALELAEKRRGAPVEVWQKHNADRPYYEIHFRARELPKLAGHVRPRSEPAVTRHIYYPEKRPQRRR